MAHKIMLVGAGHMGRSALSILASCLPEAKFTVVDRSEESLALGSAIAPGRIVVRHADITRDGLDAGGMDLVVNFAGPFFLGSDQAARAAIAAGAAYIDVGDDAEGTRTILDLDASARAAGWPSRMPRRRRLSAKALAWASPALSVNRCMVTMPPPSSPSSRAAPS